jgi:hypothetical protein
MILPKAQHYDTVGMPVAVAIFSFVVLLLVMHRDLGMFDEGIVLSDAMRVLHGDIIHRDFYSIYGPGQYYAVAAMFRFFGENFMAARLYDLVIKAAVLATLFYILVRQCPLLITLIFTAAGGMWLGTGAHLYPIFPCMLLSLIGSYLVTRVGEGAPVSPAIVGAGACTGLTALFRYDIGFFLLIAHILSIAMLIAVSRLREARGLRFLTVAAAYGGGTAAVFAPAAIVFLVVSPLGPFLSDIVDYPTKYYALMRGLPFPGLHAIRAVPSEAAVYLPLLAGGLALTHLIQLAVQRIASAASRPCDNLDVAHLIVFGSTAVLLFLKGVVRPQAVHMLLGIIPALVVFAILVKLWWRRGTAMRVAATVVLLLVLFPAAYAAMRSIYGSLLVKDRSTAAWLVLQAGLITLPAAEQQTCESGPASGIAKLSPDYSRVATYLGAHTRKDERIFAALGRHDKIMGNSVSLYFAVGRLPGTHWHQFDPGLQTRADIQAAIIGDLRRNRVRWVVRDASLDDVNEPNGSSQSSGITLLDRYLDTNYRLVAASGKVAIWLANGETPVAVHSVGECEAAPVH